MYNLCMYTYWLRVGLLTIVAKFIAVVRHGLLVETVQLLICRLALFPVLGSEKVKLADQYFMFYCRAAAAPSERRE